MSPSRSEIQINRLQFQIQHLEQRIAALQSLQEVAQTFTSDLQLNRLLTIILSSALDVMQASAGSLLLYDSQTNELVFEVVLGGSGKALRGNRIRTDQGLAGWVFSQRKSTVVHQVAADERFTGQIDESFGYQTTSLVAVPLIHKNTGIGVLEVLNKKSGERFNADDKELLQAFAAQAAIVIENARLYQQVVDERDRILAVEEQVRRELARDLHDGPSQLLASMIMGLRFLKQVIVREPERVEDELKELERLANSALHQVRDMLFDLRPVALETQGIAAALQVYVERQKESRQIEFHLDTQAFTGRFPPRVEAASFSILQEAVNNVEKHAQAKNIWIGIKPANNKISLSVRDDGHGFDMNQVQEAFAQRGNMGLLNMKERAEIAGGKLTIESKPGKGTLVTLDLPLDPGTPR